MALTKIEKALLDTIAYAEGTLGVSNNGYDVVVTFKLIQGWTKDTKIVHGNGDWYQKEADSTAAGRYQFKGSSWISINDDVNLPMTKDNQDAAAVKKIKKRLKQTFASSETLTIEEITTKEKFDIFLQKTCAEWASFPITKTFIYKGVEKKAGNGFYSGQGGKKSAQELWEVFQLALSKY